MIFRSPGMAMPMIKQLFAVLLMHTISGCLCSISLSVWIGKSHKILHSSFSSTESGRCSYHLSLHSKRNFLNSSHWNFFATLSCLFRYWFFAILGKALMMCDTFNIFVAKVKREVLEIFPNAILHVISSNRFMMCSTKETFSLPFQLSFPQPLPFFYFPWGTPFSSQIVHVVFFASTLSTVFFSFLSCSH